MYTYNKNNISNNSNDNNNKNYNNNNSNNNNNTISITTIKITIVITITLAIRRVVIICNKQRILDPNMFQSTILLRVWGLGLIGFIWFREYVSIKGLCVWGRFSKFAGTLASHLALFGLACGLLLLMGSPTSPSLFSAPPPPPGSPLK